MCLLNIQKVTNATAEEMKKLVSQQAEELKASDPRIYVPQQFSNPANPEVHKLHTALEIMEQAAKPIHGFCSGIGTGGTLSGIGATLKAQNPNIEIWAVEPENAAILAGGTVGTHLQMGPSPVHTTPVWTASLPLSWPAIPRPFRSGAFSR